MTMENEERIKAKYIFETRKISNIRIPHFNDVEIVGIDFPLACGVDDAIIGKCGYNLTYPDKDGFIVIDIVPNSDAFKYSLCVDILFNPKILREDEQLFIFNTKLDEEE